MTVSYIETKKKEDMYDAIISSVSTYVIFLGMALYLCSVLLHLTNVCAVILNVLSIYWICLLLCTVRRHFC